MYLTYANLKSTINEAGVFLPYKLVLEEMLELKLIRKMSHSIVSSETRLEYTGENLAIDVKRIRKDHYIVSVAEENLPDSWLPFNETLSDLAMQCKKSINFYVPYYDLKAATYFRDLSMLKIKKTITVYSPEEHFSPDMARRAIKEFENNGFACNFSSAGNHAKVYIFDDSAAIIGSFNFTKNGIYSNTELGVLLFGNDIIILKEFLQRRER